jgi:hypothetical protein
MSYLTHLYEALSSPLGKVITTSDREALRQHYYKARREANDPELDVLSFVPSPTNPDELWIVRRAPKS